MSLQSLTICSQFQTGITVEITGTYKNGFIYKYIDGDQCNADLYDEAVARKTAIKMARLHRIDLSELASKETAVSKFKDNPFLNNLKVGLDKNQKESPHEELRTELPLYSELDNEYDRLHNLVLERNAYGRICLCHNDLNMSNLLIEKKTKEPVFIDFEWVRTF